MSRIVELRSQIPAVIDQIYENARTANQMRSIENEAALRIQAWFRGMKIRAYIRHLSQHACRIQQVWRGKLGRRDFRARLDQKVRQLRLDFFNQRAIIVKSIFDNLFS
jgi:hypothetical protein